MGDASMSVEQDGVVIGQQKNIMPEASRLEVAFQDGRVNLDSIYQNELTRFKAQQAIPGKKSWKVLESRAKENNLSTARPQRDFNLLSHPEPVGKISVLAQALKIPVDNRRINELQTIIENPDYLDFAALLAYQRYSIGDNIPILDNMKTLDKAGVLKPLVNLYRCGVIIEEDKQESLERLFDGDKVVPNPSEAQQEVVKDTQTLLGKEEVQNFLQDPQKQEFVGLLVHLRGGYTETRVFDLEGLSELENLFGKGGRKKEAIYILSLMQSDDAEDSWASDISLEDLNTIVSRDHLMETLSSQEFFVFLKTLQDKTGYEVRSRDIYDINFDPYEEEGEETSILAILFRHPEITQELLQDTTIEVIKALNRKGKLKNFNLIEDYISFGHNPAILRTIRALRGLGLSLDGGLSQTSLEKLSNSPEIITTLESPELKSFVEQLVKEFKWDLHIDDELRDIDELCNLFQNKELMAKLFSERTKNIFRRLQVYGYDKLWLDDVEDMVNAPSDFPDFIAELNKKYGYTIQRWDLSPLIRLSTNEDCKNLLDMLVKHGYQFRALDFYDISQLIPHSEKLSQVLATIGNVVSKFHNFDIRYAHRLLQLLPYIGKLPDAITALNDVLGYTFNVEDAENLVFVLENNLTKERLLILKQVYDRHKNQHLGDFNINHIQALLFIEQNEDTISRLESYNYEFRTQDIPHLRMLLQSPDKQRLFQALDILRDNLPFSYNPNNFQDYVRLTQISGIKEKLKEVGTSGENADLMQENNFKLFVALRADVALYNHARRLILDDYFTNIRDAQNRLQQFYRSILNGTISDDVLAKIFAVSGKATELDRIALKYEINAGIAKAAQNENWQGPLLQATNFQEANEALTRMMTDLTIPVIYSGLEGEELSAKQNELIELAGKDKEFDDILEISCRSVGIYGQIFLNKGHEFDVLMDAIRQSLELNLERNPKAYLQKRAEFSSHQFDRIFEGMPEDVRERVMKTWLDLSPRRRLTTSGLVVTAEEATLNRLNTIKDIIQTDLSVHLQQLSLAKIKELEQATERGRANEPLAEQLAIYKQYLLTPEGAVRQDIPRMYRSIEKFIRSTQQALKNPGTPKEEKAKLGKSLGVYQAISDSLKSLYKLGTINEQKYKAKRDYLNETDKHIGKFSGALKRLRILDPERISADVNIRALEEEVLLDFSKLRETMMEEGIEDQVIFETDSTVSFRDLAQAPEMTQSCQRLTERTGYNHAAYSRLLDASNEMVDIYEMRDRKRNRLARSFIELSKIRLTEEGQPRLAVLIDREYVNPQYQNFSLQFSTEMISHMLDRIGTIPELSLIFNRNRFVTNPQVEELLRTRGYRVRQVSGEYFINESNVKLKKYYDSLGGLVNVGQPYYIGFRNFYLIEKS